MRRHKFVALATALVLAFACVGLVGCEYMSEQVDEGETLADRVASGQSVRAERASKTMEIPRTTPAGKKPKGIEKDTWTIFVYLCGSDLETRNGAATRDLSEMVGASGSENVSFVVETGGAKKWQSRIDSKKRCRYLIQNGSIMEVDSQKAASMGTPSTLSDFIKWGLKNYPAEHMGLILWDHGGGSITGVCFDEKNNYDALPLGELNAALINANGVMWQKFDFIGFDACLMGTLETANVLASYANYMIASQETEPATGWEYGSIIEYLSKNPSSDGAALGKVLCDTYYESLSGNAATSATLALIDLSQMDDLIQNFYKFSQEMYESGNDQGTLAAMTRGIKRAEKYGTNNMLEGYTNMVDLGGLVKACADVTPSAEDVQATMKKAIVHQVRGRGHGASSGLSVYYPFSIKDGSELTTFQCVAPNTSYLSYVDRLAHGATYNGGSQYTSYSSDAWASSSDLISMLMGDEQVLQMLGLRSVDPRWAYVEEHDSKSQVVTFAEEPQVNDDGVFWMRLDQAGIDNSASVSGLVYTTDEDGDIALGETYDVYGDWETGLFEDGFDGKWLSLPDGQNLCLYVVDAKATEDENDLGEVVYTSPVNVNGEDCYLRLRQDLNTGDVEVEGIWHGENAEGAVDRSGTPLEKGDKIIPLYSADSDDIPVNERTYDLEGDPYEVPADGLTIDYDLLPEGTYHYAFNVADVFGDNYVTDKVELDVEQDGIYFVGE